jgi:hypothetical protein
MTTVILYGTNTFTRHLIDWQRENAEYWCWNEVGSLKDDRPGYWAKRVDLLLQMHAPPIWRNHNNLNHGRQQKLDNETYSNSHYDWLQRPHEYPIYMQEHYDDVPSSVKYPLEEVVRTLLPNIRREVNGQVEQVRHFTSSTAYAIALALYLDAIGEKQVEQIELYGIEMSSDTEYVRQRDGVTFWLGIALGRGKQVVTHSPIFLNGKLYGYTGEVVIQRQEFEMSLRSLDNIIEQTKADAFEAKGRSQALLDALLKTTSQADANRILPEFIKALNAAQDTAYRYGEMAGRYQENSRYVRECDELIQAAGGEKALQVLMENATA